MWKNQKIGMNWIKGKESQRHEVKIRLELQFLFKKYKPQNQNKWNNLLFSCSFRMYNQIIPSWRNGRIKPKIRRFDEKYSIIIAFIKYVSNILFVWKLGCPRSVVGLYVTSLCDYLLLNWFVLIRTKIETRCKKYVPKLAKRPLKSKKNADKTTNQYYFFDDNDWLSQYSNL